MGRPEAGSVIPAATSGGTAAWPAVNFRAGSEFR